jgi:hypothetical protein
MPTIALVELYELAKFHELVWVSFRNIRRHRESWNANIDEIWTKRSRQAKTPSHSAWAESVGRGRSGGTYPSRITKHLPDQTSRGVAKLGGQNHIFGAPAPYCDFSVFEYILLPAPLNYACSMKLLKKVILTIPRISRRERRTEKNYFAPQPYPLRQFGGNTGMLSAT